MNNNIFNAFKNQICFLLLISLFGACSPNHTTDCIDLNREDEMSFSAIFPEVKIIQLETRPENLIHRIGQVEYFEGRYYILDWQSQQIFVFTELGEFVFKISAKGNGPGEYHHLEHFSIDGNKRQLVLLDPVVQKIHFFSIEGEFIESRSLLDEVIMGYSQVFVVNDSLLLLTSITNEQASFYNLKESKIIARKFPMKTWFQGFTPRSHYQFNGRTYAIPALSQKVMDITEIEPTAAFHWCFGEADNNPQQIEKLLEELEARQYESIDFFRFYHDGVGPGKFLNHHIIKASETHRFRVVLVEHDSDFKHVIIDKRTNQTHVFSKFNEGISLIFSEIKQDRVIAYNAPMKEYFLKQDLPELAHRTYDSYQREILDEAGRATFDRHDPMNQNPFLVVYTFRK